MIDDRYTPDHSLFLALDFGWQNNVISTRYDSRDSVRNAWEAKSLV